MIDRSSYFSKKVTFLNVMLTFLIVIRHASTPGRWGLPLENYPFIYNINVLTQIGVPMFFFISGLLFYRNCDFKDIERKLHTRIYSLMIPYILWNTLFVGLYFILTHSAINKIMNMGGGLNNPIEIITAIINSEYTPLWFVKDLMIFCVLSAGIFIALRKKIVAFTTLALSIILALSNDYNYDHIFLWFPMYFCGAIVGKYYTQERMFMTKNSLYKLGYTIFLLVILVFLYIASIITPNNLFYFQLLSPIIIWFLTDFLLSNFLSKKFQTKQWMTYMFFIYCTHYFLLNILQKLIVLVCPPTILTLNLTFIISPVITVLILISIAHFLSKYKFYTYLSGGR